MNFCKYFLINFYKFLSGPYITVYLLIFLFYRVNSEFLDCQDTQEDKDQR